jgi:hypothetical protein
MEGYDPAAAAAAAAAGAPYPPAGAYAAGVDANGEPRAEGEAGRGAGEQTIARQLILSKGSDPMANDMSSTVGLVTAFGISKSLTKGLKQGLRTYTCPKCLFDIRSINRFNPS